MLNIWKLKNTKQFCDVMIMGEDKIIYAHSCILAANSPILLDKLIALSPEDWSVKKPLKIDITDLIGPNDHKVECVDCLSKVVDHMYSVKIYYDSMHFEHLLELSRLLQLSDFITGSEDINVVKSVQKNRKRKVKPVKFGLEDKSPMINCNLSKVDNTLKISNSHFTNKSINTENPKNTKNSTKMENKYSNEVTNIEMTGEADTVEVTNKLKSNENCGEFNCLKCKINFECYKLFNFHKKVFHKKNFVCLSCNFTTLKLSYMVFHLMNTKHEENYCSICLYKASEPTSLQIHLADHKNDLPYKCYICDNVFRSRTEWLRHSTWHSRMDELLLCKICGVSFESKLVMNSHLLTHKDVTLLSCKLCGTVAQDKKSLDKHIEKHKKKMKRFCCPVTPCQFTTMYKHNLKDHLKSHEVTKSFSCKICSLKFTLEKNLFRHLKTMHNEENAFYNCCRCGYKNARIDKAKIHCETAHSKDPEALLYLMKQHHMKKANRVRNKKNDEKVYSKIIKNENNSTSSSDKYKCENKDTNLEKNANCSSDPAATKTFILSETTGEFRIISENKGESISVASVTSTNVLTIGNFREGTGSVTLNETTGVLTLNNINSESTGVVFLNESTGELSYLNLGNDNRMEVDHSDSKELPKVQIQLNECTGEMCTVSNENEIPDFNDDDALFDSFDMDIGEDSCDGFDDLDGLLFDSIDFENSDIFLSRNQDSAEIPHLNETTGELSFDHVETQPDSKDLWNNKHCSQQRPEEDSEGSYTRPLLNEVTGELMT